jgi:hypothetical protein
VEQCPSLESTRSTFSITKTCPEVGEEEESMAYIAIAKLYPYHKLSYTRMCIHYTYLSPYLSLRLYEISSMEYICSKSAICFPVPRRFLLSSLFYLGVLLC